MRKARVDENQPAIVEALRDMGCTVQHLHRVGEGCPDLLVGIQGVNLLIEVKDGTKPPSERKLTKQQKEWHICWNGQVCVVESVIDATELILKVLLEWQSFKHQEKGQPMERICPQCGGLLFHNATREWCPSSSCSYGITKMDQAYVQPK